MSSCEDSAVTVVCQPKRFIVGASPCSESSFPSGPRDDRSASPQGLSRRCYSAVIVLLLSCRFPVTLSYSCCMRDVIALSHRAGADTSHSRQSGFADEARNTRRQRLRTHGSSSAQIFPPLRDSVGKADCVALAAQDGGPLPNLILRFNHLRNLLARPQHSRITHR
jgi:hypothetical protein